MAFKVGYHTQVPDHEISVNGNVEIQSTLNVV